MDAFQAEMKPGRRKRVRARVKANECLACKARGKLRRGLCTACYHKFRRRLIAKPEAERAAMEQRAIREGLLLEIQQVRAIRHDDPFSDL